MNKKLKRILIGISSLLVLAIVLFGGFYAVVTSTPRAIRKTALEHELIPSGVEQAVRES